MDIDVPLHPVVPLCCYRCGSRRMNRVWWDLPGWWCCEDCNEWFQPMAALPRPDWLRVGLEASAYTVAVLNREGIRD